MCTIFFSSSVVFVAFVWIFFSRSFSLSQRKLNNEYCKQTHIQFLNIRYRCTELSVNQKSLIVSVVLLRPNCNDPNLFYGTFTYLENRKPNSQIRICDWFAHSAEQIFILFGNCVLSMINYIFLLGTILVQCTASEFDIRNKYKYTSTLMQHLIKRNPPQHGN